MNEKELLEVEYKPKLNLSSRLDALEEEIKVLKVMMRQMAERISDLEKAN